MDSGLAPSARPGMTERLAPVRGGKTSILRLPLLAGALVVAPIISAAAQQWPDKPVTLVVAFPAGGADDALARLVAPKIGEALGQNISVVNKGGQGGMVGGAEIAKSAPDGYSILLGSSATHALSQALYKAPLYDAATDFEPIRLLVQQPMVLAARNSLDASDMKAFTERAHLRGVRYGSAGAGSATHIACARLTAEIKSEAVHVPYAGGGPAMKDLIAGTIDYFCPVITIAIPPFRKKTITIVATLGATRSQTLPDVPTAIEQGLGDFTATTWFGLFAPKNTPSHAVEALNRAADAALRDPDVQKQLLAIGADPALGASGSPGYLKTFLAQEIAKYRAAVKRSAVPVQ